MTGTVIQFPAKKNSANNIPAHISANVEDMLRMYHMAAQLNEVAMNKIMTHLSQVKKEAHKFCDNPDDQVQIQVLESTVAARLAVIKTIIDRLKYGQAEFEQGTLPVLDRLSKGRV